MGETGQADARLWPVLVGRRWGYPKLFCLREARSRYCRGPEKRRVSRGEGGEVTSWVPGRLGRDGVGAGPSRQALPESPGAPVQASPIALVRKGKPCTTSRSRVAATAPSASKRTTHRSRKRNLSRPPRHLRRKPRDEVVGSRICKPHIKPNGRQPRPAFPNLAVHYKDALQKSRYGAFQGLSKACGQRRQGGSNGTPPISPNPAAVLSAPAVAPLPMSATLTDCRAQAGALHRQV
jgi:hypothetical protein